MEEEARSAEAAIRACVAEARTRSEKSRAIGRIRKERASSDYDSQAGGSVGSHQASGVPTWRRQWKTQTATQAGRKKLAYSNGLGGGKGRDSGRICKMS
ncbi:hypothetical protein PHYPSEUDO_011563 [Phytophthora pseudosyringae]|uniref:Uncharacterized protein n=1 Tax=Phytophthora pseudosyringae TaxID=221518 RepID=A0A8T1W6M7_9STRA|nr:hypothetical protein PHYPSEUDO_011563 [Phytophthora pseudosyringae]